jgi:hypothetical protein
VDVHWLTRQEKPKTLDAKDAKDAKENKIDFCRSGAEGARVFEGEITASGPDG